jgi:integrase
MPDFCLLHDSTQTAGTRHKRKPLGQKPPLKPREVWAIRIRLQLHDKPRDLALFNLAIDSKLRSCDLVALRITDVVAGNSIKERTVIVQQKTGRPVQFELTEQTREAARAWIAHRSVAVSPHLFPSRFHYRQHLSTRQYARLLARWITGIGLDPRKYSTHSLRRTKAVFYRKTGNLRAVQLLLGHTKLGSTVRYLGI